MLPEKLNDYWSGATKYLYDIMVERNYEAMNDGAAPRDLILSSGDCLERFNTLKQRLLMKVVDAFAGTSDLPEGEPYYEEFMNLFKWKP